MAHTIDSHTFNSNTTAILIGSERSHTSDGSKVITRHYQATKADGSHVLIIQRECNERTYPASVHGAEHLAACVNYFRDKAEQIKALDRLSISKDAVVGGVQDAIVWQLRNLEEHIECAALMTAPIDQQIEVF